MSKELRQSALLARRAGRLAVLGGVAVLLTTASLFTQPVLRAWATLNARRWQSTPWLNRMVAPDHWTFEDARWPSAARPLAAWAVAGTLAWWTALCLLWLRARSRANLWWARALLAGTAAAGVVMFVFYNLVFLPVSKYQVGWPLRVLHPWGGRMWHYRNLALDFLFWWAVLSLAACFIAWAWRRLLRPHHRSALANG